MVDEAAMVDESAMMNKDAMMDKAAMMDEATLVGKAIIRNEKLAIRIRRVDQQLFSLEIIEVQDTG